MNEEFIDQEQPKKFPTFLKVLLILSSIAVGFAMLSVIISLLSGPPSTDEIERTNIVMLKQAAQMEDQHLPGMAGIMRKTAEFSEYQQINFWPTFGLNLLSTLTGFMAIMYMRRLRKIGFHFYVIYNLLAVFGVYIFVPVNLIPVYAIVTGAIISAIFVMLYAVNLKHLK